MAHVRARPPDIPRARSKVARARLPASHCATGIADKDVDLRQAGLRERPQLVEAAGIGDRRSLAAVGDGYLGSAASKAVQEAHPVVPGGTTSRVGGPPYHIANALRAWMWSACWPRANFTSACCKTASMRRSWFARVGIAAQALERRLEVGQGCAIGTRRCAFSAARMA